MAEKKVGPCTRPAAVGAWKSSTRAVVRSEEMVAGAYGEIKASGGYRVGMGEGRGYQQPRAFCSYGEALRAMESPGEL